MLIFNDYRQSKANNPTIATLLMVPKASKMIKKNGNMN